MELGSRPIPSLSRCSIGVSQDGRYDQIGVIQCTITSKPVLALARAAFKLCRDRSQDHAAKVVRTDAREFTLVSMT